MLRATQYRPIEVSQGHIQLQAMLISCNLASKPCISRPKNSLKWTIVKFHWAGSHLRWPTFPKNIKVSWHEVWEYVSVVSRWPQSFKVARNDIFRKNSRWPLCYVTYFLIPLSNFDQRKKPLKFGWNWTIPCWVVNGYIFGSQFEYANKVIQIKCNIFWKPIVPLQYTLKWLVFIKKWAQDGPKCIFCQIPNSDQTMSPRYIFGHSH